MKEAKNSITVNINELDREVMATDYKKDRLNVIKILRKLGRENKIGQFDASIGLLRQFQTIIALQLSFIRTKHLEVEYEAFMEKLGDAFPKIFRNFQEFTRRLEEDSVPIF